MDRVNPVYIPRNHLVEEALTAATAGDLAPFERLLDVVGAPVRRARPAWSATPSPRPRDVRPLPHLLRHLKRREERLAANEAELRAVNEELPEAPGRRAPLFFCECSETICGEFLNLPEADYAEVHRDPMQFVVFPGHEDPSIETVVSERDGYFVVRKPEDVRHVVDPGR